MASGYAASDALSHHCVLLPLASWKANGGRTGVVMPHRQRISWGSTLFVISSTHFICLARRGPGHSASDEQLLAGCTAHQSNDMFHQELTPTWAKD